MGKTEQPPETTGDFSSGGFFMPWGNFKGRVVGIQYKRKRREQRLIGLLLIAASVLYISVAVTGATVEDRDCTGILFTVPLGVYLMCARKIVID